MAYKSQGDMSTPELLQLYFSTREALVNDCYGPADLALLKRTKDELLKRGYDLSDDAVELVLQAKKDIEDEFYTLLDEGVPEIIVDAALAVMLDASSLTEGYYSRDDVTLAVRAILSDAVELWAQKQLSSSRPANSGVTNS